VTLQNTMLVINNDAAKKTINEMLNVFHWHNPSGRTMALGST